MIEVDVLPSIPGTGERGKGPQRAPFQRHPFAYGLFVSPTTSETAPLMSFFVANVSPHGGMLNGEDLQLPRFASGTGQDWRRMV